MICGVRGVSRLGTHLVHPHDGLARMHGVGLEEVPIHPVLATFAKHLHEPEQTVSRAFIDQQPRRRASLGDGLALFLQASHRRALFHRGQHGGQSGGSGANHHDVVVEFLRDRGYLTKLNGRALQVFGIKPRVRLLCTGVALGGAFRRAAHQPHRRNRGQPERPPFEKVPSVDHRATPFLRAIRSEAPARRASLSRIEALPKTAFAEHTQQGIP